MGDKRRKPGVAFWATVVLSLPVLYVLSFGPATWACSRGIGNRDALLAVYRPLVALMAREYSSLFRGRKPETGRGNTAWSRALSDGFLGSYAELFISDEAHWFYFVESEDPDGEPHIITQERLFLGTLSEANSLCTF
jgi:hypothetical protein